MTNAVCRGAVLSGEKCGVAVSTPDSPMLSFDGPRLWSYSRTVPQDGRLLSWLTNNKWDTNFRTHCAGYLEARYVIEPYTAAHSSEYGEKLFEENEYELLVVRA